MSRQAKIFILAHFYPVFAAFHLYYGQNNIVSIALFFIVPGTTICYLLYIWERTSHIKLSRNEVRSIRFFIYFCLTLYSYYTICVFAARVKNGFDWISDHNTYMVCFIIYTLSFYIYNYCSEHK